MVMVCYVSFFFSFTQKFNFQMSFFVIFFIEQGRTLTKSYNSIQFFLFHRPHDFYIVLF